MNEHDDLIEQLCRDARPVKRPAPPWARATGWMLVALPCGFLASQLLPQVRADWFKPGALWAALWILASFWLGALALTTAFTFSIAGRRITRWRWRWLAASTLAWLLIGLIDVTGSADPLGQIGAGKYCYTFMLVAGAPMVAIVIAALRRTRSLHPVRTLAIAGLGVAAMAQILLGFCHPVAGELADLTMHFAAALTLVVITALAGRPWVRL
jgi:hypothetical protein